MSDKFNQALEEEVPPAGVPGAASIFGTPPPRRVTRVAIDEKAIIPQENGGYLYKRFAMSPIGMQLPDDANGDEWMEVGWVLKSIQGAFAWWVGDWALFAMHHWNWTAAQVAEQFDYEPGTIEVYASICNGVPGLIRNKAVFFSHH